MKKKLESEYAELKVVSYEQNYLQFRSLNQIMWQIPVLAMTLTGGLWFGVSRLDDNDPLVLVLLFTAFLGNSIFLLVLMRFRYVMAEYLKWLERTFPAGFVSAKGEKFPTKSESVRFLFQILLGWAALASFGLFLWSAFVFLSGNEMTSKIDSVDYYNEHALALADGYELVEFELAYPFLVPIFRERENLSVLDLGSGTGRDAAWIAKLGHNVVAVEPSIAMRSIGERIHSSENIIWIDDRLPDLPIVSESLKDFDVILLNAVWMHLPPAERITSLATMSGLLADTGEMYISLRLGPEISERDIYKVTSDELERLADLLGLEFALVGEFEDLLGRKDVRWQFAKLSHST